MANENGIEQTLKEMELLRVKMAELAAQSNESGEIDDAVGVLDKLAAETDAIDTQLLKLNEQRSGIVDKMAPYHELLSLTGHSHKTMGAKKKSGGSGGTRGKVKDSKTGKVYATGADACKDAGIEVGGASAFVKWKQVKGYELERLNE